MGSLSNESFESFIESLKEAGIRIKNESELRERLAEARRWREAFTTLASNGRLIGIRFEEPEDGCDEARIQRAFSEFQFPERAGVIFAASRKAAY
ncbi:MAG: hypothetical protein HY778_00370 [Betaproteobacteria bacterium]|nr:hypothetical protein [Betaproteobacteria bacterium]